MVQNTKSRKLSFVFIVLMLSVLCSVSSLADFQARSRYSELNVCSCSTKTDIINVKNTGIIPANYFVQVSGDGSKYTTIAPGAFSLDPGQSKDITTFISAPCQTVGSTSINVGISSDLGENKEFSQEIIIKSCPNLVFEALSDEVSSCPCKTGVFNLVVQNTGTSSEIFFLETDQYQEYLTFSEESFVLTGGEKKKIELYTNFPCTDFGEKDFIITSTAANAGYRASIPLKLKIDACYDYSISADANSFSLCETDTTAVPITLSNDADVTNMYSFEIIGPVWASLKPAETSLSPLKKRLLELDFTPDLGDKGQYNISIIGTSERGSIKKDLSVLADVKECYIPKVSIDKEKDVVCCDGSTYPVIIKNEGTVKSRIDVLIEGPVWSSISPASFELNPGEEGKATLSVNPPCDIKGGFEINLAAYVAEKAKTTTEDGKTFEEVTYKPIVGKDKLVLDVKDQQECYQVEADSSMKWISPDGGKVVVGVKNTGFRSSDYSVSLDGPDWINLETELITLDPGATGEVVMQVSPEEVIPRGSYPYTLTFESNTDEPVVYSSSLSLGIQIPLMQTLRTYWWIVLIVGLAILLWIIVFILVMIRRKRFIEPQTKIIERQVKKDLKKDVIIVTDKIVKKEEKKVGIKKKKEDINKLLMKEKESPWRTIITIFLVLLFLAILGYFIWTDMRDNQKGSNATITDDTTAQTTDTSNIPSSTRRSIFTIPTTSSTTSITDGSTATSITEKEVTTTTVPLTTSTTTIHIPITTSTTVAPTTTSTTSTTTSTISTTTVPLTSSTTSSTSTTIPTTSTTSTTVAPTTTSTTSTSTSTSSTTTTEKMLTKAELIDEYVKDLEDKGVIPSQKYIIWEKNTPVLVDLSKYYSDADQDTLVFSVKSTENITVTVDDSGIATFTPETDFIGIRTVRFMASDGKGGNVTSPEIILVVRDSSTTSTNVESSWFSASYTKVKTFVSTYRYYIIAGIVLAIFIIAVLASSPPKDDKSKKKGGKKMAPKKVKSVEEIDEEI